MRMPPLLAGLAGLYVLLQGAAEHLSPTTEHSNSTSLTYLALGDSITWGCGTGPGGGFECRSDAAGYRIPLVAALEETGHSITTIGALQTGPAWAPHNWTFHAGYSGWRIDQVDGALNLSLRTSSRPPDLITIHLGTNDCGQGAPLPGVRRGMHNITEVMAERMESLLGHIFEAAPQAHVFLASIIGMPQNRAWVNCSTRYNALLPGMTDRWAAEKGMNIVYVPMYEQSEICTGPDSPRWDNISGPALERLCCKSMVHPTPPGYLRMASTFALSITEALGPPPAPPAAPPPAPAPPATGQWVGPYHRTYGDKDCPNVGCHGGQSAPLTLSQCEALCDRQQSGQQPCNAMNFSPMNASGAGGCCLRACPVAYGPPRGSSGSCCAYYRKANMSDHQVQ